MEADPEEKEAERGSEPILGRVTVCIICSVYVLRTLRTEAAEKENDIGTEVERGTNPRNTKSEIEMIKKRVLMMRRIR